MKHLKAESTRADVNYDNHLMTVLLLLPNWKCLEETRSIIGCSMIALCVKFCLLLQNVSAYFSSEIKL